MNKKLFFKTIFTVFFFLLIGHYKSQLLLAVTCVGSGSCGENSARCVPDGCSDLDCDEGDFGCEWESFCDDSSVYDPGCQSPGGVCGQKPCGGGSCSVPGGDSCVEETPSGCAGCGGSCCIEGDCTIPMVAGCQDCSAGYTCCGAGGCTTPDPGGSCFTSGTRITMADGLKKEIQNIVKGDKILSYDIEQEKKVKAEVDWVWSGPHDDMYIINDNIHVSSEHPFWTLEKGWAAINPGKTLERHGWEPEELKVGYHLMNENKKYVLVSSIIENFGSVMTYNFGVPVYNAYFANNILVHNKDCVVKGCDHGSCNKCEKWYSEDCDECKDSEGNSTGPCCREKGECMGYLNWTAYEEVDGVKTRKISREYPSRDIYKCSAGDLSMTYQSIVIEYFIDGNKEGQAGYNHRCRDSDNLPYSIVQLCPGKYSSKFNSAEGWDDGYDKSTTVKTGRQAWVEFAIKPTKVSISAQVKSAEGGGGWYWKDGSCSVVGCSGANCHRSDGLSVVCGGQSLTWGCSDGKASSSTMDIFNIDEEISCRATNPPNNYEFVSWRTTSNGASWNIGNSRCSNGLCTTPGLFLAAGDNNKYEFIMQCLKPDNAPDRVKVVQSTNICGTVDIAWRDNSSDETGFKIYRSNDKVVWEELEDVGAGIRKHGEPDSCRHTNEHYYKVCAYTDCGGEIDKEICSDPATSLTCVNTPPDQPTPTRPQVRTEDANPDDPAGVLDTNIVSLEWTHPVDSDREYDAWGCNVYDAAGDLHKYRVFKVEIFEDRAEFTPDDPEKGKPGFLSDKNPLLGDTWGEPTESRYPKSDLTFRTTYYWTVIADNGAMDSTEDIVPPGDTFADNYEVWHFTPLAPEWWQTVGRGDVHANGVVKSKIPNSCTLEHDPLEGETFCHPYLMLDDNYEEEEQRVLDTGNSVCDGFVRHGLATGSVDIKDANDNAILAWDNTCPNTQWFADSNYDGEEFDYEWWEKHLVDEEKGPGKKVQYLETDILNSVPSGAEVLLRDGNVTIPSNFNPGGFFMIVVRGDITFNANVTRASGIYIAENITIGTNGPFDRVHDDCDDQFVLENGSLISWEGMNLSRDIGAEDSETKPSMIFKYGGNKSSTAPKYLRRVIYEWQHVPG